MTKVKTIKVQNLKAISEMEVNFNGCTAIITGGNNKGKSSLLRSLTDRLANNGAGIVLRQGSADGFAEWTLTNNTRILWNFKEDGKDKLTVITADEIKGSLTKDLRERLFGTQFDIDSFLKKSEAEQYKMLEKMAGIDFTDVNARYKTAYDDRTFKNRRRDEERARLLPVDESLPAEPLPTAEIEADLQQVEAHNSTIQRAHDAKKNHQTLNETSEKLIEEKRARVEELLKQIDQIRNEIVAEENLHTEREGSIKKIDEWLADAKNAPKGEYYVTARRNDLQNILNQNTAIEENKRRIAAKAAFADIEKAAADADAAVKKIESEKAEMVHNAKLPAGFGFAGDGITYNGLPFNKAQLSSSAVYIAALKLAATTLGEVKMLHFDASFLDRISLDEVNAWAESEGLQLLIERPDFDGGDIKYELIENNS